MYYETLIFYNYFCLIIFFLVQKCLGPCSKYFLAPSLVVPPETATFYTIRNPSTETFPTPTASFATPQAAPSFLVASR